MLAGQQQHGMQPPSLKDQWSAKPSSSSGGGAAAMHGGRAPAPIGMALAIIQPDSGMDNNSPRATYAPGNSQHASGGGMRGGGSGGGNRRLPQHMHAGSEGPDTASPEGLAGRATRRDRLRSRSASNSPRPMDEVMPPAPGKEPALGNMPADEAADGAGGPDQQHALRRASQGSSVQSSRQTACSARNSASSKRAADVLQRHRAQTWGSPSAGGSAPGLAPVPGVSMARLGSGHDQGCHTTTTAGAGFHSPRSDYTASFAAASPPPSSASPRRPPLHAGSPSSYSPHVTFASSPSFPCSSAGAAARASAAAASAAASLTSILQPFASRPAAPPHSVAAPTHVTSTASHGGDGEPLSPPPNGAARAGRLLASLSLQEQLACEQQQEDPDHSPGAHAFKRDVGVSMGGMPVGAACEYIIASLEAVRPFQHQLIQSQEEEQLGGVGGEAAGMPRFEPNAGGEQQNHPAPSETQQSPDTATASDAATAEGGGQTAVVGESAPLQLGSGALAGMMSAGHVAADAAADSAATVHEAEHEAGPTAHASKELLQLAGGDTQQGRDPILPHLDGLPTQRAQQTEREGQQQRHQQRDEEQEDPHQQLQRACNQLQVELLGQLNSVLQGIKELQALREAEGQQQQQQSHPESAGEGHSGGGNALPSAAAGGDEEQEDGMGSPRSLGQFCADAQWGEEEGEGHAAAAAAACMEVRAVAPRLTAASSTTWFSLDQIGSRRATQEGAHNSAVGEAPLLAAERRRVSNGSGITAASVPLGAEGHPGDYGAEEEATEAASRRVTASSDGITETSPPTVGVDRGDYGVEEEEEEVLGKVAEGSRATGSSEVSVEPSAPRCGEDGGSVEYVLEEGEEAMGAGGSSAGGASGEPPRDPGRDGAVECGLQGEAELCMEKGQGTGVSGGEGKEVEKRQGSQEQQLAGGSWEEELRMAPREQGQPAMEEEEDKEGVEAVACGGPMEVGAGGVLCLVGEGVGGQQQGPASRRLTAVSVASNASGDSNGSGVTDTSLPSGGPLGGVEEGYAADSPPPSAGERPSAAAECVAGQDGTGEGNWQVAEGGGAEEDSVAGHWAAGRSKARRLSGSSDASGITDASLPLVPVEATAGDNSPAGPEKGQGRHEVEEEEGEVEGYHSPAEQQQEEEWEADESREEGEQEGPGELSSEGHMPAGPAGMGQASPPADGAALPLRAEATPDGSPALMAPSFATPTPAPAALSSPPRLADIPDACYGSEEEREVGRAQLSSLGEEPALSSLSTAPALPARLSSAGGGSTSSVVFASVASGGSGNGRGAEGGGQHQRQLATQGSTAYSACSLVTAASVPIDASSQAGQAGSVAAGGVAVALAPGQAAGEGGVGLGASDAPTSMRDSVFSSATSCGPASSTVFHPASQAGHGPDATPPLAAASLCVSAISVASSIQAPDPHGHGEGAGDVSRRISSASLASSGGITTASAPSSPRRHLPVSEAGYGAEGEDDDPAARHRRTSSVGSGITAASAPCNHVSHAGYGTGELVMRGGASRRVSAFSAASSGVTAASAPWRRGAGFTRAGYGTEGAAAAATSRRGASTVSTLAHAPHASVSHAGYGTDDDDDLSPSSRHMSAVSGITTASAPWLRAAGLTHSSYEPDAPAAAASRQLSAVSGVTAAFAPRHGVSGAGYDGDGDPAASRRLTAASVASGMTSTPAPHQPVSGAGCPYDGEEPLGSRRVTAASVASGMTSTPAPHQPVSGAGCPYDGEEPLGSRRVTAASVASGMTTLPAPGHGVSEAGYEEEEDLQASRRSTAASVASGMTDTPAPRQHVSEAGYGGEEEQGEEGGASHRSRSEVSGASGLTSATAPRHHVSQMGYGVGDSSGPSRRPTSVSAVSGMTTTPAPRQQVSEAGYGEEEEEAVEDAMVRVSAASGVTAASGWRPAGVSQASYGGDKGGHSLAASMRVSAASSVTSATPSFRAATTRAGYGADDSPASARISSVGTAKSDVSACSAPRHRSSQQGLRAVQSVAASQRVSMLSIGVGDPDPPFEPPQHAAATQAGYDSDELAPGAFARLALASVASSGGLTAASGPRHSGGVSRVGFQCVEPSAPPSERSTAVSTARSAKSALTPRRTQGDASQAGGYSASASRHTSTVSKAGSGVTSASSIPGNSAIHASSAGYGGDGSSRCTTAVSAGSGTTAAASLSPRGRPASRGRAGYSGTSSSAAALVSRRFAVSASASGISSAASVPAPSSRRTSLERTSALPSDGRTWPSARASSVAVSRGSDAGGSNGSSMGARQLGLRPSVWAGDLLPQASSLSGGGGGMARRTSAVSGRRVSFADPVSEEEEEPQGHLWDQQGQGAAASGGGDRGGKHAPPFVRGRLVSKASSEDVMVGYSHLLQPAAAATASLDAKGLGDEKAVPPPWSRPEEQHLQGSPSAEEQEPWEQESGSQQQQSSTRASSSAGSRWESEQQQGGTRVAPSVGSLWGSERQGSGEGSAMLQEQPTEEPAEQQQEQQMRAWHLPPSLLQALRVSQSGGQQPQPERSPAVLLPAALRSALYEAPRSGVAEHWPPPVASKTAKDTMGTPRACLPSSPRPANASTLRDADAGDPEPPLRSAAVALAAASARPAYPCEAQEQAEGGSFESAAEAAVAAVAAAVMALCPDGVRPISEAGFGAEPGAVGGSNKAVREGLMGTHSKQTSTAGVRNASSSMSELPAPSLAPAPSVPSVAQAHPAAAAPPVLGGHKSATVGGGGEQRSPSSRHQAAFASVGGNSLAPVSHGAFAAPSGASSADASQVSSPDASPPFSFAHAAAHRSSAPAGHAHTPPHFHIFEHRSNMPAGLTHQQLAAHLPMPSQPGQQSDGNPPHRRQASVMTAASATAAASLSPSVHPCCLAAATPNPSVNNAAPAMAPAAAHAHVAAGAPAVAPAAMATRGDLERVKDEILQGLRLALRDALRRMGEAAAGAAPAGSLPSASPPASSLPSSSASDSSISSSSSSSSASPPERLESEWDLHLTRSDLEAFLFSAQSSSNSSNGPSDAVRQLRGLYRLAASQSAAGAHEWQQQQQQQGWSSSPGSLPSAASHPLRCLDNSTIEQVLHTTLDQLHAKIKDSEADGPRSRSSTAPAPLHAAKPPRPVASAPGIPVAAARALSHPTASSPGYPHGAAATGRKQACLSGTNLGPTAAAGACADAATPVTGSAVARAEAVAAAIAALRPQALASSAPGRVQGGGAAAGGEAACVGPRRGAASEGALVVQRQAQRQGQGQQRRGAHGQTDLSGLGDLLLSLTSPLTQIADLVVSSVTGRSLLGSRAPSSLGSRRSSNISVEIEEIEDEDAAPRASHAPSSTSAAIPRGPHQAAGSRRLGSAHQPHSSPGQHGSSSSMFDPPSHLPHRFSSQIGACGAVRPSVWGGTAGAAVALQSAPGGPMPPPSPQPRLSPDPAHRQPSRESSQVFTPATSMRPTAGSTCSQGTANVDQRSRAASTAATATVGDSAEVSVMGVVDVGSPDSPPSLAAAGPESPNGYGSNEEPFMGYGPTGTGQAAAAAGQHPPQAPGSVAQCAGHLPHVSALYGVPPRPWRAGCEANYGDSILGGAPIPGMGNALEGPAEHQQPFGCAAAQHQSPLTVEAHTTHAPLGRFTAAAVVSFPESSGGAQEEETLRELAVDGHCAVGAGISALESIIQDLRRLQQGRDSRRASRAESRGESRAGGGGSGVQVQQGSGASTGGVGGPGDGAPVSQGRLGSRSGTGSAGDAGSQWGEGTAAGAAATEQDAGKDGLGGGEEEGHDDNWGDERMEERLQQLLMQFASVQDTLRRHQQQLQRGSSSVQSVGGHNGALRSASAPNAEPGLGAAGGWTPTRMRGAATQPGTARADLAALLRPGQGSRSSDNSGSSNASVVSSGSGNSSLGGSSDSGTASNQEANRPAATTVGDPSHAETWETIQALLSQAQSLAFTLMEEQQPGGASSGSGSSPSGFQQQEQRSQGKFSQDSLAGGTATADVTAALAQEGYDEMEASAAGSIDSRDSSSRVSRDVCMVPPVPGEEEQEQGTATRKRLRPSRDFTVTENPLYDAMMQRKMSRSLRCTAEEVTTGAAPVPSAAEAQHDTQTAAAAAAVVAASPLSSVAALAPAAGSGDGSKPQHSSGGTAAAATASGGCGGEAPKPRATGDSTGRPSLVSSLSGFDPLLPHMPHHLMDGEAAALDGQTKRPGPPPHITPTVASPQQQHSECQAPGATEPPGLMSYLSVEEGGDLMPASGPEQELLQRLLAALDREKQQQQGQGGSGQYTGRVQAGSVLGAPRHASGAGRQEGRAYEPLVSEGQAGSDAAGAAGDWGSDREQDAEGVPKAAAAAKTRGPFGCYGSASGGSLGSSSSAGGQRSASRSTVQMIPEPLEFPSSSPPPSPRLCPLRPLSDNGTTGEPSRRGTRNSSGAEGLSPRVTFGSTGGAGAEAGPVPVIWLEHLVGQTGGSGSSSKVSNGRRGAADGGGRSASIRAAAAPSLPTTAAGAGSATSVLVLSGFDADARRSPSRIPLTPSTSPGQTQVRSPYSRTSHIPSVRSPAPTM